MSEDNSKVETSSTPTVTAAPKSEPIVKVAPDPAAMSAGDFIRHYPVGKLVLIVLALVGAGGTGGFSLAKAIYDRASAGGERCRKHQFRVEASKWNTGEGANFDCGGAKYRVTIRTEQATGRPVERIASFFAETNDGRTEQCPDAISCDSGDDQTAIGSPCIIAPPGTKIDCRSDEVTVVTVVPQQF